jgi:hypothetical protein
MRRADTVEASMRLTSTGQNVDGSDANPFAVRAGGDIRVGRNQPRATVERSLGQALWEICVCITMPSHSVSL